MRTSRSTSRRGLLTAAVACAALAACGAEPVRRLTGRSGPRLLSAGIARKPVAGVAVEPTVSGMAAFGYDLLGVVDAPNDNVIVSPASIAYAFGMVRAGAQGETAGQIDRVLHFPATGGPHEALNAISQETVTVHRPPPRPEPGADRDPSDPPKPPVVTIANGLFPQVGLEIRQEFLRTIAAYYGAGVWEVDFTKPAAVEAINAWAEDHTAGRIRKVFDELDPTTRLVLTNAVYLKADWLTPFEPGSTQDGAFTTAAGAKVTAKLMRDPAARVSYARTDRWQAVELPYAGGELAMRVLIPADRTPPAKLLEPPVLASIGEQLRPGRVDFTMPRFDFATNLDAMKEQLTRLGMTVPFGASADFSGITARGLQIDQVVHKANITVDEYGTEAAAVTAVVMAESAVQPSDVVIRADRAFAFTIVHKPTGTPLFAGQVADPTRT
jgi:serine protease inhibitor